MKINTYRNVIVLTFVFLFVYLGSCKKEEDVADIQPSISIDNQFVHSDTSLAAGTLFSVRVHLSSSGGANLTQFYIRSGSQIVFNYGFNAAALDTTVNLNKDASANQIITLTVRNSDGLEASQIINIALNGSNYNQVIHLGPVELGGQSNASLTSFYSTATGLTYLLDSAFVHQDVVDMLYFYNTIDFNALASPGANITGIYSGTNVPENWTIKNTIYYSRSPLAVSVAEFDAMTNDSLIIAHIFSDGGRKAKSLQANQVWAFMLPDGRFGFVKINAVTGTETGSVQFELKLQP